MRFFLIIIFIVISSNVFAAQTSTQTSQPAEQNQNSSQTNSNQPQAAQTGGSQSTPQTSEVQRMPEQQPRRRAIKKKKDFKFNLRTIAGNMVMNKISYIIGRVQPAIQYKMLGIALDLNVEVYMNDSLNPDPNLPAIHSYKIHDSGSIRKSEWDQLGAYPGKILYITFGDKYDYPVYIHLGRIHDLTFGTGFLVQRYQNNISYPDITKTGLEFKVDFVFAGVEGFCSDVLDLDLFGGRVFIRPFGLTDFRSSIIGRMEFGFSYVTDTNMQDRDRLQDVTYVRYDGPGGDTIKAYNFDIIVPVLKSKVVSFSVYYNIAKVIGGGYGHSLGLRGDIANGFLEFQIEARRLEHGFIAPIFTSQWDVQKKVNYFGSSGTQTFYDYMLGTKRGWGYFVEFKKTWLKRKIGFFVSFEDDWKQSPHLQIGFFMKRGVLSKRMALKITLDKINMKKDNFYKFTDLDTLFTLEVSFLITSHLDVAFTYLKKVTEGMNNGDLMKLEVISLETRITF